MNRDVENEFGQTSTFNPQPTERAKTMRTRKRTTTIAASCLIGTSSLIAQPFNSGSTGSYGPLNVTNDTTLNMPADGIFNCTTINVASGATLRFNKNALNTPVYLLATGDVVISGTIDVSGENATNRYAGRGGPGGFDGGFYRSDFLPDGEGQGPGGGQTRTNYFGAVYAFPSGNNGRVYGNSLLMPLLGGSGGAAGYDPGFTQPFLCAGGGASGGGGGGALLTASTTRITVSGSLVASGGNGIGGGSGGAIRVMAAIVDGSGSIYVRGGRGENNSGCGTLGQANGSDGRTRIDSLDRYSHRNIYLNGRAARGTQMIVFPPGNPRLDIIEAAGRTIPEGTNNSVSILLPAETSTNQTVKVRTRGFTNDIPITVAVTPENGPSARFDSLITFTGDPSQGEVAVILPRETVNHIYVWTR